MNARCPTARRLLGPCALLAAAAAGAAPSLSTRPAPGLWEGQQTVRINGQDLGAVMRAQMTAMLDQLPPAQRAQAESMMRAQAGGMLGGTRRECVTAALAARLAEPASMLADLNRDNPNCRFDGLQVEGSEVRFQGRCENPKGFTGDVHGRYTLRGDKAWDGEWGGEGRMPALAQMPGMKAPADGVARLQVLSSGHWVAASCGDVQPRAR
jgi:hypothetical protein